MTSTNAVRSDEAQAQRKREQDEDSAVLAKRQELVDGPSAKALEALIAAAEDFLGAHRELIGVSQEGLALRSGWSAGELGMPVAQEERLSRVAKEMRRIVTDNLRHHLPSTNGLTRSRV